MYRYWYSILHMQHSIIYGIIYHDFGFIIIIDAFACIMILLSWKVVYHSIVCTYMDISPNANFQGVYFDIN
jgi:hypothetical protein